MEKLLIRSESEMLNLGASMVSGLKAGDLVFLKGNLGTGKTTLVRGMLNGYGWSGMVKSPTYTLIEEYVLKDQTFYHFDLYRLKDSEELEMIGIRDMIGGDNICLVEWPEKAGDFLPSPDIEVSIRHVSEGRDVNIVSNSR